MLSIIIPTFNEIKNGYIQKIFPLLKNTDGVEVICVDSNSTDGTVELINQFGFNLYKIDSTSRAARLNKGIAESSGEMILLHHPRSLLSVYALNELKEEQLELYWGAFTHKFDLDHKLLRFTSWYSNKIRGDLRKIFYLDHCIFARSEIFEDIGPIPEVDIFEDTEICKLLNTVCDPIRLEPISTTSAVRFSKNGIWTQAIKNQLLKWKYYFKVDHKKMNIEYEQKVNLNARYDSDRDT
jgi:glycosyltransferase involved in cell wall biosynthesis